MRIPDRNGLQLLDRQLAAAGNDRTLLIQRLPRCRGHSALLIKQKVERLSVPGIELGLCRRRSLDSAAPLCRDISRTNRRAAPPTCQRVPIASRPASLLKRVLKSSVNHAQVRSRTVFENVSCRPLTTSSMTPRCNSSPVHCAPRAVLYLNEPRRISQLRKNWSSSSSPAGRCGCGRRS